MEIPQSLDGSVMMQKMLLFEMVGMLCPSFQFESQSSSCC